MWVSEQPEDSRDQEQKKKREYFLELQHQIELKRLREQEMRKQEQELERQFQVDDRSPSKWLVQGGQVDDPPSTMMRDWQTRHFWFPRPTTAGANGAAWVEPVASSSGTTALSGDPEMRPSTAAPSGSGTSQTPGSYSPFSSASNHLRFRVTDQHETNERLRERARKLEWRRVLDEQVAEQARKNRQQQEEKQRYEQELAKMERDFAQDLHFRAQRKIGLTPPSPALAMESSPTHNYVALPSPPRPRLRSSRENSANESPSELSQREGSVTRGATPPPAPVALHRQSMGSSTSQNEVAAAAQLHPEILDEYHRLLNEIRNEAALLRKEKEEIRQERTLLRLENERTAHLLERNLEIQQLHRQETVVRGFGDEVLRTNQDASLRQQRASVHEEASYMRSGRLDAGTSASVSSGHAMMANNTPTNATTSMRLSRPNGVTLEDFATPQTYRPPSVRLSPRSRPRQPRNRDLMRENPLEQSLNGESVFIPLSGSDDDVFDDVNHGGTETPLRTSSGGHKPLEPSSVPSVYQTRVDKDVMASSAGSVRTPSPKRKPSCGVHNHSSESKAPDHPTPPAQNHAQAKSIVRKKSIEDNRIIKSSGFYNIEQQSATPEPIFGGKRGKRRGGAGSLHDSMKRSGSEQGSNASSVPTERLTQSQPGTSASDRPVAASPTHSPSNLFQVVSFV